jgi:hypothetical protein
MRIVYVMLLLLSFTGQATSMQFKQVNSAEDKDQRPAPYGDTRMGADAAGSGTDITDQDIQAQEDKKGDIHWDSGSKELPIEEEDDLESVQN